MICLLSGSMPPLIAHSDPTTNIDVILPIFDGGSAMARTISTFMSIPRRRVGFWQWRSTNRWIRIGLVTCQHLQVNPRKQACTMFLQDSTALSKEEGRRIEFLLLHFTCSLAPTSAILGVTVNGSWTRYGRYLTLP